MGLDNFGDIELRHLITLRALATTGSFHGAADELEYTQSAVSQHLAALEAIVGARLVERSRGRRTIALTEAGQLLLRHSEAIVARLHAAQADLAAYAEGAAGLLRVGTYQSVGHRILPELVRRFTAAWPGVEIKLTESASDDALVGLVERGELDLTFAIYPLPAGPFATVQLLHDPYVVIVPTESPMARRRRPPSLEEITALPLIGFRQCRSTEVAEAHLRSMGLAPKFVFRSDDNGTVQGLVAAGVGAALVPLLAMEAGNPGFVAFAADVPPRLIALAWHRDRYRSPAALAFTQMALALCAELQPELTAAVA